MSMWAPIEHATEEGRELQALGEAFVGRHVIPRYRGYMQSQAKRLLGVDGGGHGQRGSGGRPELIAQYGYDTKYAMHCARLGFQCIELLTTGALQLPLLTADGDWLRAVRHGEVDFDEWWERVLELDAQLESMLDDDSIRPGADRDRIESWSIATHQKVWERLGI